MRLFLSTCCNEAQVRRAGIVSIWESLVHNGHLSLWYMSPKLFLIPRTLRVKSEKMSAVSSLLILGAHMYCCSLRVWYLIFLTFECETCSNFRCLKAIVLILSFISLWCSHLLMFQIFSSSITKLISWASSSISFTKSPLRGSFFCVS